MKRNWLLWVCAITFTSKANGTNRSRKLRNGLIPENPKREFEAFGELSGSPELTEDRAVEHVFGLK